jgi:hypothetical protein
MVDNILLADDLTRIKNRLVFLGKAIELMAEDLENWVDGDIIEKYQFPSVRDFFDDLVRDIDRSIDYWYGRTL